MSKPVTLFTGQWADMTFEKNEKNEDHGMVYLFELDKKYDIDGDVSWNTAKYINHSCDPNAGIRNNRDIVAMKPIREGEEIVID